jgi:hypothetical protein
MKLSLFAELRRRNVFKAAAAYLALGWIVVRSRRPWCRL